MGFVVGALILEAIALFFGRDRLALSARHCLILALLFWFPAVLFGFTDWVHYYGRVWFPPIMIKIFLAGVLFVLLLATLYYGSAKKNTPHRVMLSLCALCFVTVVLLGWHGARLIYGLNPQPVSMQYKSGYQVFKNKCASCHPDGGNTIDAARPVNNSPKLRDIDTFRLFVRHPDGIMPPFPAATLPDHETENLYQYLRTWNEGGRPAGSP